MNDRLLGLLILDETHYYPFGLKQKGYEPPPTYATSYKYKFQNQEFQDELGLNWYSYKYRNYDPAIGRFMVIDPLAENYAYQSPYNFSENRVIDARELEGLEAVKVTDLENNQVNVTVRVKPINNTVGTYAEITDKQMQTAFNNFKSQAEKSWSGKNSIGQQVNVQIINDPEATLTMEFRPLVDSSVNEENGFDAGALGFVANKDFGNTQTGNIQISTENTFSQFNASPYSDSGAGATGNHELGHIFNVQHNEITYGKRIGGNLMNEKSVQSDPGKPIIKERNILPEQRDIMLLSIPE